MLRILEIENDINSLAFSQSISVHVDACLASPPSLVFTHDFIQNKEKFKLFSAPAPEKFS